MPTCYCLQEPSLVRDHASGRMVSKDLSSASRYGKIVFLLGQEDKPSITPGPSTRKIVQGLQAFTPGDYLFLAGGDPVAGILLGAALRNLNFSEVQVLRWEREVDPETGRRLSTGYYVPTTVRLNI